MIIIAIFVVAVAVGTTLLAKRSVRLGSKAKKTVTGFNEGTKKLLLAGGTQPTANEGFDCLSKSESTCRLVTDGSLPSHSSLDLASVPTTREDEVAFQACREILAQQDQIILLSNQLEVSEDARIQSQIESEAQLRELQAQLAHLTSSLRESQLLRQQAEEESTSKLAALQAQITLAKEERSEEDSRFILALQNHVKDLQVSAAESSFSQINLNDALGEAEARNEELAKQVAELEARNRELESVQLEQNLSSQSLENQLIDAREQLDEKNILNHEQILTIESLQQEASNTQKMLEEKDARCSILESRLIMTNVHALDQQSKIDQQRKAIHELEGQVRHCESVLDVQSHKHLTDLDQMEERAEKEMGCLILRSNVQELQISKLEESNARLIEEKQASQQNVKVLQNDKEKLEESLDGVYVKYAQARLASASKDKKLREMTMALADKDAEVSNLVVSLRTT